MVEELYPEGNPLVDAINAYLISLAVLGYDDVEIDDAVLMVANDIVAEDDFDEESAEAEEGTVDPDVFAADLQVAMARDFLNKAIMQRGSLNRR